MPKVSIIVPNYNHARFLNQRLDSIFNQTYQDYEVILLDDCSKDNSVEILNDFTNHPKVFQLVVNKENIGNTFKQWNTGVKLARGEYVWIAESDDWAENDFLEILVPVLENNANVGLVYCQSWIVDENNVIIESLSEWTNDLSESKWRNDYINKGVDEFKNYFVHKSTIPNASAVLFRKDIYLKQGGANEKFKYQGDALVWTKFLLNSDISFIAKNLNYYRRHNNTVRYKTNRIDFVLDGYRWINFVNKKINVESTVFESRLENYCNYFYFYFIKDELRILTIFFLKSFVLASKTDKKFIAKFFFYSSSNSRFIRMLFDMRMAALKLLGQR